MIDSDSGAYYPAQNQDLGRQINERIRKRTGPEHGPEMSIICECIDRDCEMAILITPAQYEWVRENDSHFIVVEGHESSTVERVLRNEGAFLIVEKIGPGSRFAEESAGGP
ncbi:hypothetical protein BH23ACT12_BH23ACT12_19250 [soil metagenome]